MIKRHNTNARMSQCVEVPFSGRLVMTAGITADDTSGDVKAQTAEVLAKIDRNLAVAGTDKRAAYAAYIWLPDIADFDAMNEIWDAWVPDGSAPTRACVEARLANPDLKVEIQILAFVPAGA
ncbi:RidA family protein [Amaricoccus tamworthensis]|uniref:RidA family protein n=1 Tax=Amaricoccus tamworthensis TaxID=57002 RepID=UPI003C7E6C26